MKKIITRRILPLRSINFKPSSTAQMKLEWAFAMLFVSFYLLPSILCWSMEISQRSNLESRNSYSSRQTSNKFRTLRGSLIPVDIQQLRIKYIQTNKKDKTRKNFYKIAMNAYNQKLFLWFANSYHCHVWLIRDLLNPLKSISRMSYIIINVSSIPRARHFHRRTNPKALLT